MAKKGAVTRLRKELHDFYKDPPPLICVAANEKNILDWDYLLQGPKDTPYEGGLYHGRLRFPPEYPHAPPEIVMYTPNGRFKTHTPLCLSMSSFHPETWNPAWSVATILKGLLSFMVEDTPTEGAIHPLPCPEERKAYAARTHEANASYPGYRKMFPDGFIVLTEDGEVAEAKADEKAEEKAGEEGKEDAAVEVAGSEAEKQGDANRPLEEGGAEASGVAPATGEPLAVGRRVRFQKMAARPDLNNTEGTVTASKGTRWTVELDGKPGETVNVRATVLVVIG